MSSLALHLTVFVGSFIQHVQGLPDCSATGCQNQRRGNLPCPITSTPSISPGIEDFNVSFSSQPLTWILAESSWSTEDSAGVIQNFYLGSPPSLSLHQRTDYAACALIFDGISSNLTSKPLVSPQVSRRDSSLQVSQPDENDPCDPVLGSSCASALLSQVKTASGNISSQLGANGCSKLASILQASPPQQCSGITKNWGTIIARNLFGPNSTQPIQQNSCPSTVGQGYELSLISSISKTGVTSEVLHSGGKVVTPLLTISFPTGGNRQSQSAALSCLAPVRAASSRSTVNSGSPKDAIPKATLLLSTSFTSFILLSTLLGLGDI